MRASLLSLPLTAVVLAGCSAGDAGSARNDPKQAYVSQANQICRENDPKIDAIVEPTSPESAVTALDQFDRITTDTLTRIEALDEPPADAQRIEQEFYALVRQDLTAVRRFRDELRTAVQKRDVEAVNEVAARIQSYDDHDDETTAFLNSYGMSECAKFGKQDESGSPSPTASATTSPTG